jgi:uncharacterized protein (TIGR02266 family)
VSRDAASPGARPLLLFVDDLAMFRELGALWLARFGRVVTAASGGEAWRAALEQRPDLVVLDLGLPDEPGADWVRRAKAQHDLAGVPILALASGGRAAEHAAAVRAGADDVLAKPLERMALVESVARFLAPEGRRGLPRAPLEAPVRWWSGAREARATARNVSRGGLFVEGETLLPVASELRLELSLPEAREAVTATACVVWRRSRRASPSPGMGVRFLDLDRASARALAHHVREWQGDALAAPLPLAQEIAS